MEHNSPPRVDVNNVHVLQLLKNVASYRPAALAEMGWAASISLAPTIDPTEGTNTETSPKIDLPCHRSCSFKLMQ